MWGVHTRERGWRRKAQNSPSPSTILPMMLLAIVLALASFFLLVLTVQTEEIIFAYLLIATSIAGIAVWGIDTWRYARRKR